MNLIHWKTSDPEWMKKREKDWLEVEGYLAGKMSPDLYSPKKYMMAAKQFFIEGKLQDGDEHDPLYGLNHFDLFLLHPNLNIEEAREIIDISHQSGQSLKGAFSIHYLVDKMCEHFIKNYIVQPDIVEVIVEAFYGKNYDEAAKLREFDKVKECSDAHSSLLKHCAEYLARQRTEYFPAMQLLPFLVETTLLVTKEGIKHCGYYYKNFARRIKRYPERKGEYTDKQKAFFEAYMQAIRDNWDQINPAIQEYYREPLNMS